MRHFFSNPNILRRAEAYTMIIGIVMLTAIMAEASRVHALPDVHQLLSHASNALMHFVSDVIAAEVGAKSITQLFLD